MLLNARLTEAQTQQLLGDASGWSAAAQVAAIFARRLSLDRYIRDQEAPGTVQDVMDLKFPEGIASERTAGDVARIVPNS